MLRCRVLWHGGSLMQRAGMHATSASCLRTDCCLPPAVVAGVLAVLHSSVHHTAAWLQPGKLQPPPLAPQTPAGKPAGMPSSLMRTEMGSQCVRPSCLHTATACSNASRMQTGMLSGTQLWMLGISICTALYHSLVRRLCIVAAGFRRWVNAPHLEHHVVQIPAW